MTVTSIATVPLKHGERPDDTNTSAGTRMQGRISDILKSSGAQRCYWGRAIEEPDLLYLFVDWDTLQQHIDFINNPYAYPIYPKTKHGDDVADHVTRAQA